MQLSDDRREVLMAIAEGTIDTSYASPDELEFLIYELSDEIFEKTLELSMLENPSFTFVGTDNDTIH